MTIAGMHVGLHSKKMLGCFNPTLGQIWTNPVPFLTQHLGLSIFNPYLTQIWVKKPQHF